MALERKQVEVFTDGACSGNPGPGGWGVVLRYRGSVKELSGGEDNTTNNRMELTAVIEALSALKGPCAVTLTTIPSMSSTPSKRAGSTAGGKTAGCETKRSPPSTWTCGKSCLPCSRCIRSPSSGSRGTPATQRTNAATRLRWVNIKRCRNCKLFRSHCNLYLISIL